MGRAYPIVILLVMATTAGAQVPGMAGSGLATVRGIDAAGWNPANLSLPDGPGWSIGVGSASMVLGNSAFSVHDYMAYNGAFLDDEAKQDILSSIGSAGWRFDGEGMFSVPRVSDAQQVPGFYFPALQVGGTAFFGGTHAHASGHMTRETAELFLDGSDGETPWSLGANEATTSFWSEAGVALSARLGIISFGVAGRYVEGHYHAESTATGDIEPLYQDGILSAVGSSGTLGTRSAEGGTGYAVDAGLAIALDDGVFLSAAVSNATSSIFWNSKTRYSGFTFDTQLDSSWVDEDLPEAVEFDEEIDPFETILPMIVRAGIGAELSDDVTIAADCWSDESFEEPSFAAGIQWAMADWLPLRAGVESDALTGVGFGFGFGIHLGPLHLDAGAGSRGGPVARGVDASFRLTVSP